MMTWKIAHSLQTNIDRFKITVDRVVLPDGDEKTFSYLGFGKGVCILPITKDHKVVCMRQYRHAIKKWQWELPAGTIEDVHSKPIQTAEKELEEETGYVAEHWLELGSFYPSAGSTAEEVFLFAAAGLSKTEQQLENSEQIELHELTMEEVKKLVIDGEFEHGAGLATILRYKFMTD
jgi:ADP-ribose pyrophosphatase